MAVAKGWTLGIARSIETIPSDLHAIRPTIIFSVPRIYQNAYNRIRLRMGGASAWRKNIFNWGLRVGMKRIHNQKAGASWPTALAFACVNRLIFARVRAAFGGRLRLAISGGAALGPDIAEFFQALGILILEGYGLTETSTVSHVNRPQSLAPYEAIRNFSILERDFTVEEAELTPTLKPRRQFIAERYKELLEEMYRKAS
jgi:long-chain acyl-CoA synthetase